MQCTVVEVKNADEALVKDSAGNIWLANLPEELNNILVGTVCEVELVVKYYNECSWCDKQCGEFYWENIFRGFCSLECTNKYLDSEGYMPITGPGEDAQIKPEYRNPLGIYDKNTLRSNES